MEGIERRFVFLKQLPGVRFRIFHQTGQAVRMAKRRYTSSFLNLFSISLLLLNGFTILYTREHSCGILQSMKTILITAGEDIITRNILATDFWPTFKEKNTSARIVLVVQPEREGYFKKIYSDTSVSIESFKRSSPGHLEQLVMTLARSGIKSGTNLWSKMRSYERGHSNFIATYVKRFHTFLLGNNNAYKRFLRRIILRLPSDKNAEKLFDTYHPDVLVALSLTNFDFDVPLAREAKKRGVKLLGMPRSWDNFSSHGLLRVVPDVLFLQNVFLKEMALRYQVINETETPMVIVGLPHYDLYLEKSLIESREHFYKRNNLDSNKKTILYMGMGEFLFKREGDIIDILETLIDTKKITEPVQVLYSPHPKFKSSIERAQQMKNVVLCDEVGYVNNASGSWDSEKNNTVNFINLILNCEVSIMGASTNAIDALTLNKPVICIGFDGVAKEGEISYWDSVKRFYDSYTHFEALMDAGAVLKADSSRMLTEQINQTLKNPIPNSEARQRVLERFVEPLGGAGKRLAEAISREIEKIEVKN